MSLKPPNNPLSTHAGFTLLELMISIAIMTFISLGIYQMTSETFHLRDVLSAENEFYNSIRMSMDVVQRDVVSLYTPIIAKPPEKKTPPADGSVPGGLPAPANNKDLAEIMSSDAGRTTDFWLGATEKTGIRSSRFVGTDTKMSFIAVSHIRIYRDAAESDFAKITYELENDKDNRDAPGSLILVKSESPNAFEDDSRKNQHFERKFPLLHGIKKLQYRYWRKDKDRWESSWDSDKEDMKDKYPDIVEVKFEVIGPQKLSFDGIYKFRPEVPLRGLDPSS